MSHRTPPLGRRHADAGAKMTAFGDWEMPVEFDSIRTEHSAVRESVGKFGVSHMGELEVSGPDAAELMDRLTTNDVAELDPGDAQYSTITDSDGVILDDTVVYRLPAWDGTAADYLFIPNAGHDEAMADRWAEHADRWGLDAVVENATEDYGMIAVQGPDAIEHLGARCDDPGTVSRFTVEPRTIAGVDCFLARTGYTGEDGVELLFDANESTEIWDALECQPCGLGARDTLRLEAGFLLSGEDFHPETNPRTPYEAGIGFAVKLDTEFVGRDALEGVQVEGTEEKLVGLVLQERGVPRHGYAVTTADGERIGHVTSGTMSPTLGEPVALAYLPREYVGEERTVRVVIRDEPKKARTTTTPFLS